MTKKTRRLRINTTMDETLLKELKIVAIQEEKKVNEILEEATKMYLKKRKEKKE